MRGFKPPSPSALSFSAACEARVDSIGRIGTTEVVPCYKALSCLLQNLLTGFFIKLMLRYSRDKRRQQQIPSGNDRQKSKSRFFATLRMTRLYPTMTRLLLG
jgi:hypothetical protein